MLKYRTRQDKVKEAGRYSNEHDDEEGYRCVNNLESSFGSCLGVLW